MRGVLLISLLLNDNINAIIVCCWILDSNIIVTCLH